MIINNLVSVDYEQLVTFTIPLKNGSHHGVTMTPYSRLAVVLMGIMLLGKPLFCAVFPTDTITEVLSTSHLVLISYSMGSMVL